MSRGIIARRKLPSSVCVNQKQAVSKVSAAERSQSIILASAQLGQTRLFNFNFEQQNFSLNKVHLHGYEFYLQDYKMQERGIRPYLIYRETISLDQPIHRHVPRSTLLARFEFEYTQEKKKRENDYDVSGEMGVML